MRSLERWVVVSAWMGIIWVLSSQPDLSSGLEQDFILRKIAHLTEYGILTWLVMRALTADIYRTKYLIASVVITLAYAGIDEWHQTWVVGRYGHIRDVLIDAIGIMIVAIFYWIIEKRRLVTVAFDQK